MGADRPVPDRAVGARGMAGLRQRSGIAEPPRQRSRTSHQGSSCSYPRRGLYSGRRARLRWSSRWPSGVQPASVVSMPSARSAAASGALDPRRARRGRGARSRSTTWPPRPRRRSCRGSSRGGGEVDLQRGGRREVAAGVDVDRDQRAGRLDRHRARAERHRRAARAPRPPPRRRRRRARSRPRARLSPASRQSRSASAAAPGRGAQAGRRGRRRAASAVPARRAARRSRPRSRRRRRRRRRVRRIEAEVGSAPGHRGGGERGEGGAAVGVAQRCGRC